MFYIFVFLKKIDFDDKQRLKSIKIMFVCKKVVKQTLNNDYDDLHILLQDEATYEVFKYATSMWS